MWELCFGDFKGEVYWVLDLLSLIFLFFTFLDEDNSKLEGSGDRDFGIWDLFYLVLFKYLDFFLNLFLL